MVLVLVLDLARQTSTSTVLRAEYEYEFEKPGKTQRLVSKDVGKVEVQALGIT